ncbi:acyltransferase [Bacillus cereus]|uniref:acyltransferase n=1 Tax=Bacillus cereus TaxID=1396 RepID=UPI002452E1AD|nr:acyltransferase [Bacillus cereus]MDH4423929.1 acyltransferase [Bacillus cereus]
MGFLQKIRNIQELKLFKTLSLKGRIRVYKRVKIGLGKDYYIKTNNNNNYLYLGCTFEKFTYSDSIFVLNDNATLVLNGSFSIYSGCRISVNEGAILELGSGYINYGANIACFNRISIGNNVIISENVTIRDSDNHSILYPGYQKSKPIEICDNVWISMNVTILKGVKIGSGAIVAAGSVVTKDVPNNCLVAGVPAKIIKRDVTWK